jgi:hypothetical protein
MYQLIAKLKAWWRAFMAPPADVAFCQDWPLSDHEAKVIAIHCIEATTYWKLGHDGTGAPITDRTSSPGS